MKLIHKLLIAFFIIISLIWIVAFLSINFSRQTLETSLIDSSQVIADEILAHVDMSIQKRLEELQTYSTDVLLLKTLEQSNAEFDRLDNIQVFIDKIDKAWPSMPKDKTHPFMDKLMSNNLSIELREKKEYYEETYGYSLFPEIFVTNKYGANVAQTGRTSDYRQDDEKWWREAKEKRIYIGDFEYDKSADVYGINIALRIDDEEGNFSGVIKLSLNIKETIDIIKAAEQSVHPKHFNSMNFKLSNKEGQLIYSTGDYVFFNDIAGELIPAFGLNGTSKHTDYHIDNSVKERKTLLIHAHSEGYKDYKGLGWILILRLETEEIFAPIVTLKNRILHSLLFISALALFISLIFSRSITKPIYKLIKSTNSISDGKLDAHIDIKSSDEIGLLSQSFNKMADNLITANAEIKESEEKFRSIGTSAQDAIIMIDNNGEISFWNHAAENIFGYTANEAIGRNLHALIMPEKYSAAFKSGFKQFLETGNGAAVGKASELEALKKNGDKFPVELSLSSVKIQNKWNAIGIVRDITERQQAQRELLKLSSAVEQSPISIVITDTKGKIEYVNPYFSELTGYSFEDAIGQNPSILKSGKWTASFYKQMWDTISSGEVWHGEFLNKKKNGELYWENAVIAPIKDENGEITHFIANKTDITEHKLVEHALLQEKQKMESLTTSINCGLLLLDEWTTVQYANKVSQEWFGPIDQIKGEFCWKLFDLKNPEKECVARQVLKTGEVVQGKDYQKEIKGGNRYFHVSASPVKDIDGKVTQVTLVIVDISARKQSELELINRQTELSILYNVSSAVSTTIEIDKLFDIILNKLTEFAIFKVEKKAGILLVEDSRMELVAHLGHPNAFLEHHKNMTTDDCLCGLAARTGEIVISNNSECDCNHTIRYPGMTPHGHIIVPLKVRARVVGVLYLYTPHDAVIGENKINILSSLGNLIGIAIDNAKLYEETKSHALHDTLTGLGNRRMMQIVFDRNIAQARRSNKPFSVILMDLDFFKKYNDTYGHAKGDELLSNFAKLIIRKMRQVDVAFRYGGEEFLVLLPDTDLNMTHKAAERIRKAVEHDLEITVSLGVASYEDGIENAENLIKIVDKALYSAKEKGRNRVEKGASFLNKLN